MKVVIDTNVIVSAILTPQGIPAEILRLVISGRLDLHIDERILREYNEVLLKQKFGFDKRYVELIVEQIKHTATMVLANPLGYKLPDPDDEQFVEVALAGNVEYLITGNIKHFLTKVVKGVKVVTPDQFLRLYP